MSTNYVVVARNAVGLVTGLTPTAIVYRNISTGASVTPPTITEIVSGRYGFTVTLTTAMLCVVDFGVAITDNAYRFKTLILSTTDASVPTLPAPATGLQIIDGYATRADGSLITGGRVVVRLDDVPYVNTNTFYSGYQVEVDTDVITAAFAVTIPKGAALVMTTYDGSISSGELRFVATQNDTEPLETYKRAQG